MYQNLREYINQLFMNVSSSTYVDDLKEELFANLSEKYDDLIAQGKSPEEAFQIATSSIGDIRELVSGLDESAVIITTKDLEKRRKQSALTTSISVGLFILAPALCTLFETLLPESITILLFFLPIAIGVGLLIFDNITKPEALKQSNESSKAPLSPSVQKHRALQSLASGILWTTVTALFLFFSFTFNTWHYSWVIFIFGAALQCMIEFIFKYTEK